MFSRWHFNSKWVFKDAMKCKLELRSRHLAEIKQEMLGGHKERVGFCTSAANTDTIFKVIEQYHLIQTASTPVLNNS